MVDPIFWQAWLTTTLAGALGGLVGPLIFWRRLANLGNALSHAALTPIAVASVLQIPYGWLLTPFSVFLALLLGRMEGQRSKDSDSLLNVLFVGMFSLGILILSWAGTSSASAIETLFGDILFVTTGDLVIVLFLFALVLAYIWLFRRPLLLMLLHQDMARTEGVRVNRHETWLLVFAALVVSATLKIMGAVLVTSMLLFPPLLASRLAKGLRGFWSISVFSGAIVGFCGFYISIQSNFPSGATIATLALGLIILAQIFRRT